MEQSLFIKMFGDSPKIRILDMLLTGRELDYSITDIACQAQIGRATFYRLSDDLLRSRIIKPTRKIGRIQLYRINLENPQIKQIAMMYDNMIRTGSNEEISRQRISKEKKKKIALIH